MLVDIQRSPKRGKEIRAPYRGFIDPGGARLITRMTIVPGCAYRSCKQPFYSLGIAGFA